MPAARRTSQPDNDYRNAVLAIIGFAFGVGALPWVFGVLAHVVWQSFLRGWGWA